MKSYLLHEKNSESLFLCEPKFRMGSWEGMKRIGYQDFYPTGKPALLGGVGRLGP